MSVPISLLSIYACME